MSWVAATIGALGSLGSASMGSGAADDAVGAQEDASQLALQQQAAAQKYERYIQKPYMEAGYQGLNQLMYLMGLGDPNAVAKVQENFDSEAFKNYMVGQLEQELRLKNPDMKQQKLDAKLEDLMKSIDKTGAWRMYEKLAKNGEDVSGGDFWKRPEGSGNAPGRFGEYGEFQRRFDNSLFEKDPGYQFRMDEGNRQLQGQAAARGGLLSGAAAKEAMRYNQGFASNEYMNAYNRYTQDQANKYNRLAGISGTGQTTANTLGNAAANYANQNSAIQQNLGQARASGYVAQGNIWGQAGNNMNTLFQDYWADKNTQ